MNDTKNRSHTAKCFSVGSAICECVMVGWERRIKMTREYVDGRPVFLSKTRKGWAVKWGRTIIGYYPTWKEAVTEILGMFK